MNGTDASTVAKIRVHDEKRGEGIFFFKAGVGGGIKRTVVNYVHSVLQ